jgi:hypothetical protein
MAVAIKSSGGAGHGTIITNADTGEEIKGVREVSITIAPDDLIRADLLIFTAEIDVQATPTFFAADPASGETKEVVSIQFADGSAWSPGD